MRVITPHEVVLVRQNHSRALTIPSHLSLSARFPTYAEFLVHVYTEFARGNEAVVEEYKQIPADLLEEVLCEILKVWLCVWVHTVVLRMGQLQREQHHAPRCAEASHHARAHAVTHPSPLQRSILLLLCHQSSLQPASGGPSHAASRVGGHTAQPAGVYRTHLPRRDRAPATSEQAPRRAAHLRHLQLALQQGAPARDRTLL